jgi:hypothetical protein
LPSSRVGCQPAKEQFDRIHRRQLSVVAPSLKRLTPWRKNKMLSQVRIYTINKGEMDSFLKHFKEDIVPVHERIGVPIIGSWVNRAQNEFIWIRSYKDKTDLEAKGKAFQAEVAKLGIKLGTTVAKMEVREVESAFD